MIEKPKKERRFLKTLGRVGEILIEQVLIKVGSSLIKRIGGKKTLPSILFLFLYISLYGQFPTNINKQRLGFQTTADGLVWRGSLSDTASIQPVSNQNAWVILDTVNLKIYCFDFTSNVWNQVGTGGGSAFTQPIDSLFFKTSVPPNNVDTAKMRWDSELGTVVLGMYDAVPNELGFKNFWLVKNQTGSTITKNSLVYASGTVGSSGRISVSKFIANGTIDAKYLLGITAHDLTNGEDGYVISFGKIRQVNTDTFADGAILYPSPTTAGVWTDVEPVAPNIDMPIGFCINSSSNNGTIAIRVASGYSLNELHNVAITSPAEKSSLYYSGGLWRDTTAALLVSDTTSMLLPYFKKSDTTSLNLVSRFNTKLNLSDTLNMLTPYLRKADTTAMLLPYFRDADTTSLNLVSRFATKLNISDTSSMLTNYLRTGVAASTYLPLAGGTVTGNTNFVPTTGRVIFGETSPVWDEVIGVRPRTTTSLGLGIYSSSTSYSGTLFRAQSENNIGSSYMLYEGRGNGGIAKFWVKGDGSSFFAKNMTIGSQTNYDALNIHHSGDEGLRMSYLTEPTSYFFQIRPYQSSNNVRYVFSQTNNNIFYDSVFVLNQGNIAINKLNPAYKLDVNGTLGVTGATTLSGALTVNNATVLNEGSGDFDTRIESDGNANMVFVDASTDRVGIGTNTPSKTLDVNGEVRIATVTATPTALLGKDASNVVGEVTDINQSGVMKVGGITENTSSVGIINVPHGLSYTPTKVIATIAQQSSYVIVCHGITSTNLNFTIYDSTDGTALNNVSVGFFWIAFK